MSGGDPLNVQLRVRMRYEAEGEARKALGDLDQINVKARQLGASGIGASVGRDLHGVAVQAGAAKREVVDLGQAAARFGSTAGFNRAGADLRGLTAPARSARHELEGLAAAAHRLGVVRGVRELERELERVERRADAAGRKVGQISGRGTGADRAHRHEFANEALAASGFGGAARFGMSGAGLAGIAAGGVVAGYGAALAAATRHAISFETAMAEVRKAVDDISPEKFKELESTILRASRTTGIAKENVAKLVAQGGYSGIAADDLPDFALYGAKAARAFNMSEEATGDALAKMKSRFKLSSDGMKDLGDAVNTLADTTNARESQIIDFLDRFGATGNALKMAPVNMAAFGAAILDAGSSSDVAATGFKAFTSNLQMADRMAREDKNFAKSLRTLGLSARQLKADMAADPEKTIVDVLERIAELPDAKKLENTTGLGGREFGDNILAIVGALPALEKALARMRDPANRAGSVEKSFAIFNATTERSIQRVSAAMAGFGAVLMSQWLPSMAKAAEYTERVFGGMAKGVQRFETARRLAEKMAKGEALTKGEQAELDRNPRLKSATDWQLRILREGKAEAERNRRFEAIPGAREGLDQFQRRQRELLDGPADAPQLPASPMSLPGLGRRSDLTDAARVSLAAYTDEVERGLERTERIVRDSAERMREELGLKSRVEIAAARFGVAGGARIESAAYGGAGRGGGGGVRLSPGRFGIPMPAPRDDGGAPRPHPGDAIRVPSAREAAPFGKANPDVVTPRGSGAGTRGAARTGEMMAWAMDQLRREGVPEGKLREAAAHLVGQAQMESGLDPNKVHDQGTGYGIYGARDPSPGRGRRTEMLKWLKANGYAANSAEGQMRYMAKEAMSGRFKKTRRILMGEGSGDLERDTNTITGEFESPRVINRRSGAVRKALQTGPDAQAGREAARPDDKHGSQPSQMPQGWRERLGADDAPRLSPRFNDPSRMKLKPSAPGGAADGASGGGLGSGAGSGSVQHFYGGFDEQSVARRAVLEQNREIRRSQARALHDIGRVG